MRAAVDRIVHTYQMLTSRRAAAEALAALENYLRMLRDGGETDVDRLTVCGLVYLRQRDGSYDPVREGYTGL